MAGCFPAISSVRKKTAGNAPSAAGRSPSAGSKRCPSRKRTSSIPKISISRYGADTARLFTLFAAPPEKDLEWSDQGVEGAYRFLSRLWRLIVQERPIWENVGAASEDGELSTELRDLRRAVHRTIKKVSEDIEQRFHFNTAIAAIMELFNALSAAAQRGDRSSASAAVRRHGLETVVLLLAPFVPHVASELWQELGHGDRIDQVAWPAYSDGSARRGTALDHRASERQSPGQDHGARGHDARADRDRRIERSEGRWPA